MANLSVRDLEAGMTVSDNVKDRSGRLLIPKGTELTPRHLRALKLWGIPSVIVNQGGHDGAGVEEAPLSPAAMAKAKTQVSGLFRNNLAKRNAPLVQFLFARAHKAIARRIELEDKGTLSQEQPLLAHSKDSGSLKPLTLVELIDRTETVSSLPAIYTEIVEVAYHPRSSAADMAKVIAKDTGLTARLLRIVNSAFYGFPASIDTVSRAITVVGTDELCELALATSVHSMFSETFGDKLNMEKFWRHSLCVGALARGLALKRREPNTERFFVTGLLHDVGRLVMLAAMPGPMLEILSTAEQTNRPVYDVERDCLGYSHAGAGRALLTCWNLPQSQREAVFMHHTPTKAKHYPMESAVMHMAEVVANVLQVGRSGDHLVPPISVEAWERLSLDLASLGASIDQAEEQINELMALFVATEKS